MGKISTQLKYELLSFQNYQLQKKLNQFGLKWMESPNKPFRIQIHVEKNTYKKYANNSYIRP